MSGHATHLDPTELLDSITFGAATGGRKRGQRPSGGPVRGLVPGDIEAVLEGRPTTPPSVSRLRSTHHHLAQLLAGGMTNAEAGLATGYSPAYISILRADPTFVELLSSYQSEVAIKFADVLERCKTLGLAGLDELQHRLESEPDAWSRRELMELSELLLAKVPASKAQATSPGPTAPPSFTIQLVQGTPAPREIQGEILDGITLDGG